MTPQINRWAVTQERNGIVTLEMTVVLTKEHLEIIKAMLHQKPLPNSEPKRIRNGQ